MLCGIQCQQCGELTSASVTCETQHAGVFQGKECGCMIFKPCCISMSMLMRPAMSVLAVACVIIALHHLRAINTQQPLSPQSLIVTLSLVAYTTDMPHALQISASSLEHACLRAILRSKLTWHIHYRSHLHTCFMSHPTIQDYLFSQGMGGYTMVGQSNPLSQDDDQLVSVLMNFPSSMCTIGDGAKWVLI